MLRANLSYVIRTMLIQRFFARLEDDRTRINSLRLSRGQAPVPTVDRVWTMMFFKRESRMMHHLNKKRGFAFLDDYLRDNPSADPTHFPPHRPVYLPVPRQEGWQVLVKERRGENDDFFAVRRQEADRKKKEQKAKARRAEAEREVEVAV